jgi:hypothetical protein
VRVRAYVCVCMRVDIRRSKGPGKKICKANILNVNFFYKYHASELRLHDRDIHVPKACTSTTKVSLLWCKTEWTVSL